VPVTSGKFLYNLMVENPECSAKQLINLAIERNTVTGQKFVKDIASKLTYPIIFPAAMTPARQGWEQDHFQALWLSIIAEKCTDHYMISGWEFSNGCAEEFTHSYQLKLGIPHNGNLIFFNTKESEEEAERRMKSIQIFDHNGKILTIKKGYAKIKKAVAWIEERKFEAPKLKNCLELLEWTGDKLEKGFFQHGSIKYLSEIKTRWEKAGWSPDMAV
jgi:hypothetical protein